MSSSLGMKMVLTSPWPPEADASDSSVTGTPFTEKRTKASTSSPASPSTDIETTMVHR